MNYQDFAVTFQHWQDDRYQVEVSCSLGDFAGIFEVPSPFRSAAGIGHGGEGGVGGEGAYRRFRLLDPQVQVSPKELGQQLFRALFHGPVGQALDLVRGFVSQGTQRRRCQPIRIELRMSLERPANARLHDLPWELLFDPSTNKFLSQSEQISVVRYLKVPLPSDRPPVRPPLRILLVSASVPDAPALELEAEKKAIEAAWKPSGSARLRVLSRFSLEEFEQELRLAPHVIHFMGHAEYDDIAGQGTLLFPRPDGTVGRLEGEAAAMLLADLPSLRLVVLNACETAKADPQKPFAGLATALVRAGVPAVLAMREPIADRAAVIFAKRLYQELASRHPLDLAVARARKTLAADPHLQHTAAWALPELMLRTRAPLVESAWRRYVKVGLLAILVGIFGSLVFAWKLLQSEQGRVLGAKVVNCVDFDEERYPQRLGNLIEGWVLTEAELNAKRAQGEAFFTRPADAPAARIGPYYFGHLSTWPDIDPRNNLSQLPPCRLSHRGFDDPRAESAAKTDHLAPGDSR